MSVEEDVAEVELRREVARLKQQIEAERAAFSLALAGDYGDAVRGWRAAADQRNALHTALAHLVVALPTCAHCNKPATWAWARGQDRYCDEHGVGPESKFGPGHVLEYPRAAPLRAAMALLAEAETMSLPVKVECTWGDGPDVLIVIPPQQMPYPLRRHANGEHSFGLSIVQAWALAAALARAADEASALAVRAPR